MRARVGGCGEHVPALDLSRDDQLTDPGLGISPRVLVPVHVVKALGVLRREEVLGAGLCSGGHVSESRGGSAGCALARRGGGGAGGFLLLDREEEPYHADQRDKRRGSDDRPGLAANEVAPLVEEGVDAVLDSLAERARARHPRAGLPAHLSCLLSPLHLASDSTRELQGLQEVHSLRRYLGPAQQDAVPVTLPADTHVSSPGIESTSHFSQLFHRPKV